MKPELTKRTEKRNVIVVMMESVELRRWGFGAPVTATPNLDNLAKRGVYAEIYANANQTVRGELAVLCSGMLDRMRAASSITMNPNLRTTCLQELLKQEDYSTHWFHGNTKRFFQKRGIL